MKVTVTHDDGTTVDITEGVQVAFDAVIGSLDWGSGMLDAEEEDAIVALAAACRFPDFQEIADSVRRERERVAKVQEERDRRFAEAQRAGLDAKQREHLRGKGLWIP